MDSTNSWNEQLSWQRHKSHIEKMESKNKKKATSQWDNILKSFIKGNHHVNNIIYFSLVGPNE